MNDILPGESLIWQYVESCFRAVVGRFGYQEIRFPIVEQTQLFKRSIGEVTDIVEKEMYSFDDRNGDNLSLRPEGTAGCVRAADQHGLLYNQQQRLWYQGPMFRHERPQKGRYRQFHQFGVEAFGMAGPDIDAEVLQLAHNFWQELGLLPYVSLQINNIGSADDRGRYGEALTAFLAQHEEQLDEDSRRRMHSNPMRVLDSKNPQVQEILESAPKLAEFVSTESVEHYQALQTLLRSLGIEFEENPRLVRGLDYYNNCVYEWTTDTLGAQGAVCGGGRYDGLVAQLGGKPTLAAGFAIGIERLVLMLETLDLIPASALQAVDLYVLAVGDDLQAQTLQLAARLRSALPGRGIVSHCGGGKYNSQIKRAFNAGARLAVILEQDGSAAVPLNQVKLRHLDESGDAELVPVPELASRIGELLQNSDN